jgi:glycosyltransferase involved in cell wall biosynthesis/spore maturation protein CgeB
MSPQWRVLLLDTKPGNVNHYIVLGIEAALAQDPRVESVHYADYADALPTAIERDCNLFIACDGEELDRGLCRRLASVCGMSVLWVTEDPYERERVNVGNAELFDFVFTNDSASVAAYKGRAQHLPFAANPCFNFREIPADDAGHYLYDVLFVGTAWPNRVAFLRQLLAELKGVKFKLALPGNDHLPVPDLDLAPSSYQWRVPNPEMCRLANRSRIVLTLHRNFALTTETAAATPGPRLFEVALAGGFQLVDLGLPETKNYFALDSEIAGFSNVTECLEQIRFHLGHPEIRLEKARAAQRRCLSEHLYKHRVARLLDTVETGRPVAQAPQAARWRADNKIRVLYVAHNSIDTPPTGGVEVYADLLARSLPDGFEPFNYYSINAEAPGLEVVCKNVLTGEQTRRRFSDPFPGDRIVDPERESHFANILHDLRIDLVHFHHLISHPWSLPLVARTMGLPTVMGFADHYAVCENHTLINDDRQYCGIPSKPAATCDLCLGKMKNAVAGGQASRRAFVGGVLDNLDLMVFLSQSTRDIFFSQYPDLKNRGQTWVEGYPLDDQPLLSHLRVRTKKLEVVIPGNFDFHKGANACCEIFDAMRDDPIEFHIFGEVRAPYDEKLKKAAIANVKIHGAYQPHTLRDALRHTDVALLLSIWPETYVLTLSEAWRAGVVPIVTDVGALDERVSDGVNGLKVPVNEPGSVVHALRGLIADRSELDRLRSNIEEGLYCRLDSHVQLLTEKYEELVDRRRVRMRTDKFFGERPLPRSASANNVFRLNDRWVAFRPEPVEAETPVAPPPAPVSRVARVMRHWRAHGSKATAQRALRKVCKKAVRLTCLPLKAVRFAFRHGPKATLRRSLEKVLARLN